MAIQIERKLHLPVERRLGLGGTLLAHEALRKGQIDLYPEFTRDGLVRLGLPTTHIAQEDYQHISGSQGRARAAEIAKLGGRCTVPTSGSRQVDYDLARNAESKAARLEQALEQDLADYDGGVTRKTLLAIRTGRLSSAGFGSIWFVGTGLTREQHGSGKFDHCGE